LLLVFCTAMALPSNQAFTAGNRPGGNFGGARPRGKFANLLSASTPAKNPDGACEGGASVSSDSTLTKKRRVRIERQSKIFADIDEAEALALELLSLASSTAKALSDLTDGDSSGSSRNLEALVKSNGDLYLDKVKKIHDLITPHAELVVAYRNHAIDIGGKLESIKPTDKDLLVQRKSVDLSGDKKEENRKESEHYNMYAARVEMRLAMERRDILNELLRLEKEEAEAVDDISVVTGDVSSQKRKRDELQPSA